MIQVNEMPKSGQFVAVWKDDNGTILSEGFVAMNAVLFLQKMDMISINRDEVKFPKDTIFIVDVDDVELDVCEYDEMVWTEE